MDIKSELIDSQLTKLFGGPEGEPLTGEIMFDDNTFIVFEGVKKEDLVYIKEYIEEMRVRNIEIQTHDGSSERI